MRKGGSEDFLGLRSFETGDSIRRIHWPSSAKLGRLLIVERSQARSEAVVVQLRSGKDQEVHLERACGQADRHFQRGHAVGLRSAELTIPPDQGPVHRKRLLTYLALYGEER